MIPPTTRMVKMLKGVEQQLHKNGWDESPPTLLLVTATDDRKALLMSVPDHQPLQLADDVQTGLQILAQLWGSGPIDDHLKQMTAQQQDALVGIAWSCEAWASTVPVEERGGRAIADTIGSEEVRIIMCLDVAGTYYYMSRVRGEHPTMEIFTDPQEGRVLDGPIVQSMAQILAGMTKFAPPGSVDRDKIRAWI